MVLLDKNSLNINIPNPWRRGGAKEGASLPPTIFTEAFVLKSGSTRKFSFQEVEPLLIILYNLYSYIICPDCASGLSLEVKFGS